MPRHYQYSKVDIIGQWGPLNVFRGVRDGQEYVMFERESRTTTVYDEHCTIPLPVREDKPPHGPISDDLRTWLNSKGIK